MIEIDPALLQFYSVLTWGAFSAVALGVTALLIQLTTDEGDHNE